MRVTGILLVLLTRYALAVGVANSVHKGGQASIAANALLDAARVGKTNLTEWVLLPKTQQFAAYEADVVLNGTEVFMASNTSSLWQNDLKDLATNSRPSNLRAKEATSNKVMGRVFLLFMAIDGIVHDRHWLAFLEGVDSNKYRVLLHCKQRDSCDSKMASFRPVGLSIVETVESSYCHDLVSPMVQLLRHALQESVSPSDKFVFLSDSTLPVQPFSEVYKSLMAHESSDICVMPWRSWMDMVVRDQKRPLRGWKAVLVKHSQWVVLNRDHAQTLVSKWYDISRGEQWAIPVWQSSPTSANVGNSQIVAALPTQSKIGKSGRVCTDEWAIFAALYGAIIPNDQSQVPVPGLDLAGSDQLKLYLEGLQGTCRTFVYWGIQGHNDPNVVQSLQGDGNLLSCYPQCTGTHPAEFYSISDSAAVALRKSGFLFARKFAYNAMSLDTFKRIILGST